MSSLDEQITKLHKVRRSVVQMLRDRGYSVTDDEISMTKEQFVEKYGENMNREALFMHKQKQNDSSDQILVFFPVPKRGWETISVGPVKQCFEKLESEKVFRAILVSQQKLTPLANKAISAIMPQYTMETFLDSELMINVVDHVLVPKHLVLTDEEKSALLQEYGIKETQLPNIDVHDRIARHFGLQCGQVVKIIRPSETAGEYVTYRLCMKTNDC